jgi:hypothetical protein
MEYCVPLKRLHVERLFLSSILLLYTILGHNAKRISLPHLTREIARRQSHKSWIEI